MSDPEATEPVIQSESQATIVGELAAPPVGAPADPRTDARRERLLALRTLP